MKLKQKNIKGKRAPNIGKVKSVAEIKKVKEKIKESEERYRRLFNSITDAVFVHPVTIKGKPPGRFIEVNDAACQKLGYTRKELLKLSHFDITTPEKLKNISAIRKKLLPRKHHLFEIIAVTKTGKKISLEINIHQFNFRGQPAVLSIARDITEHKQTEKKLKRREEKYYSLIRNIPDVVWETDNKGNIVFIGPNIEKIYGYTATEIYKEGKSAWLERIHPDDFERTKNEYRALFEKKKRLDVEYRIKKKDGNIIWLHDRAITTYKKDGVSYTDGILSDITERKQIEKAKDEFISIASHQLRTPLAVINCYSEILLSRNKYKLNDREQRGYLKEIYAANQQLITLTNEFLDASKIDLGGFRTRLKSISPIKLADNVVKELLPQIKKKGIKIKKIYDKCPSVINVDPDLLRIIFQNLISNAVKYTPKKGRINIGITKQKSNILIKVSDTGYGIPKTQQSKMFTKLFRASNAAKKEPSGTGLGLYIVKAVVEQCEGKIWFKSKENKGTSFYISLPLKKAKSKKRIKRP